MNFKQALFEKIKAIIVIVIFAIVLVEYSPSAKAGITNLNSCANLNIAGENYVLQNDVTSDGTCFFVSANDVTLDLNGHSVTYDNAAPFVIQNGSFESADLSGWDLSDAPAALRSQGSYLNRTLYEGEYALKIPTPLASDQILTTTDSHTLKGNFTYSASAMMWQPYDTRNIANADIHLIIEIINAADGSVLAARDSRDVQSAFTSRGFQYVRVAYLPTSNVDVKIRLKAIGGRTVSNVGQAPYGAFYFDDVRLQQTGFLNGIQNPGNNGVKFGGDSSEYGITAAWGRRGKVFSSSIGKGKIIQGQGHGDFSHAVMVGGVQSDLNNYIVDNLEITVSGNSTHAILASNAANGIISNNLIHGYGDTIEIRDHYDGALIKVARADAATGVAGKIFNNIITNGIQTGIYVAGSPSPSMLTEIFDNDITLQSKYTNDFAIVGGYGTYSAHVHDNIVRCGSGNNTCRGIFIHGSNGKIENNLVEVHYRKNNQEYGLEFGGCGGATYGIQIDVSSSNIETKNNIVTAYADECEASAFRFYAQPAGTTVNNLVHSNIFKALSLDGSDKVASSVRILETYDTDLQFFNNQLITNSCFLNHDGNVTEDENRSLVLDRNLFQIEYPKSAMYHPLVSQSYLSGTYAVPKNVSLINNHYADEIVRNDMTNAFFANQRNNFLPDTFASNIVISEYQGEDINTPAAPSGLSVM